jgi:hypothetical protein
MTPVMEGWTNTCDNARVTAPEDREAHFGQHDHVRYYGANIRKRTSDAGLIVEEFAAVEPFVSQYGLQRGEKLFRARRLENIQGFNMLSDGCGETSNENMHHGE